MKFPLAMLLSVACLGSVVFAQAPEAATQPTATLPTDQVIAVVNGQAMTRRDFTNVLIQIHGMRLFDQVLPSVLVEQACQQAGVKITEDTLRELHNKRMEQFAAQNPLIPPAQREMAFREVLNRRGLSLFEYQIGLRLDAGLLALAKGKYTPTESDIKNTFDIEYGEKYQLRDIVVGNFADAAEIRRLIEQDKRPVDDVVRERNLQSGNLMLSDKSPNVPQQIRSVAFQLQEKQLSAAIMMPDNTFHMLYLEKKIPAQADVRYEAVKEKVRQETIDAHEREIAGQILMNLRRAAKIEVYDPTLRAVIAEIQRQQTAQQAAATQPQAAPAAPAAPR